MSARKRRSHPNLIPIETAELIEAAAQESAVVFPCEQLALEELNRIGREIGYGRLQQLTRLIEDVWRSPDWADGRWFRRSS